MSKILQVENLVQEFDLTRDLLDRIKFKKGRFTMERQVVHAVNNVSFDVETGEVFSLVGESGCGKSTCARTIIRIYDPTSGEIVLDDQHIEGLTQKQRQELQEQQDSQ